MKGRRMKRNDFGIGEGSKILFLKPKEMGSFWRINLIME